MIKIDFLAPVICSVILFCLLISTTVAEAGAPLWTYSIAGDPPLTVIKMPDVTGDGSAELIAGYDSGRLLCLDLQAGPAPAEVWSVTLEGSILVLLATPDSDSDGYPEVVVGTDLGNVVKINAGGVGAGQILWTYLSTCNVSSLALMDDTSGESWKRRVSWIFRIIP